MKPPRSRLKEQTGVIAVVFALVLPALLAMLGLIIDLGFAYQYRRIMQTAADAGAMAGAHSIYRDEDDYLNDEVYYDTAKNGFDGSRGRNKNGLPATRER